ncbi:FAS1-like dehydratase domain-containing protein [Paragemmobacter aquarius]|uniref:FAS1-like dehydratase domain-containing protein n=1 Tax=Paragemmobacter aquarius TaxID=2169400 RepID=UPI001E3198A4|nr:MaoC family dehydratase N-terminal domain-containing protein [Gemmobacter aquarius]
MGGGEIAFHGALCAGDEVVRDSRIERIAEKTGSTGPLIFVSVRHDYSVGGAVVLSERQDLVYREDPVAGTPPPAYPDAPDLGPPAAMLPLLADPVRLFRFSALTFNGHRIHYDADYARDVEGYAGPVVHGPLQAVAMMVLAGRVLGRVPERFSYRGLSPLTLGQEALVEAYGGAEGLEMRVRRVGGPVTMTGKAV